MGLDVTLFSTTSTSSLDVVAATSGKSAIVRSTSTLSVLTKFGAMWEVVRSAMEAASRLDEPRTTVEPVVESGAMGV